MPLACHGPNVVDVEITTKIDASHWTGNVGPGYDGAGFDRRGSHGLESNGPEFDGLGFIGDMGEENMGMEG